MKISIKCHDGSVKIASHVFLYSEAMLLLAEALNSGKPDAPFEVGYWGDAAGAIAFGLTMNYFDTKDAEDAASRDLSVADILAQAHRSAVPFQVAGFKQVRMVGHATLTQRGPNICLDQLLPRKKSEGWFNFRQPTFAGISIKREERVRKELEKYTDNWVLPAWMESVHFQDGESDFKLQRKIIADVHFTES